MDLPSPPNSSSAASDEQSPENIYMTLPGSPTRLGHSADGSFGSDSTMDWAGVFWPPGSFEHGHVDQSMEIDPQLLSVSPAAIFGTHEPAIADPLQLATAQELAGLAPLLDAFPFDFDLSRFDNVNSKHQQPPQHIQSLHNFTPSPSPESQVSADDDIARVAREKAGIMHAVIATGSGLALSLPHYTVTPRQQPSPAASTSSSTTGSPPPTTPSDVQHHSQPPASGQVSASEEASGTKARPKTSHTTIERRYRTNLNARIVALRAAIPATAHLDAPGTVALDARGRADGVTPARKGSKATILAKAVEYITVLKTREIRLRRDTDGLRNLVGGLVGGEQLLNAWEASWRAKWGTMEDDEARLAGESIGGSDDEDSDDEDSRPAKRAKKAAPAPAVASTAAPARKSAPGIDPITGEKRKRGRPRKVPLPPTAAVSAPAAPVPVHVQQAQPQYLLAVFALFSLWSNAPASSSSTASSHTGSVVADAVQPLVATSSFSITWVQAIHLVASLAVLGSVVFPVVRRQLATLASKRSSAAPTVAVTDKAEPAENEISDGESEDMASSIMSSSSTFSSVGPGTPLSSDISNPLARRQNSISILEDDEPTRATQPVDKARASGALARALGATGAVTSVLGAGAKYALSTVRVVRRTHSDAREAEGETIDGWARLAEALVAEGDEAPFATKLQTYLTLSAARPRRADHRVALALLANSLGLPDAARTWDSIHSDSPADQSVLNRLGLEDATDVLLALADSDVQHDVSESALRRLAREWVRGEAQAVAKEAFMCVARGLPGDPERLDELKAVAAELGGREAKVALVVSACYGIMGVRSSESNAPTTDFDGDVTETEDTVAAAPARDAVNLAVVSAHADADFGDQETEDVVRVLTLFCAHTNAGRSSPKDTLALLQLLGRQTFDAPALEDARDRMVDVVRAGSRRAALPVASC